MTIEVQLNGRKSARKKKTPGVGGFLYSKMLLFLG
jgi:hypothetical protein